MRTKFTVRDLIRELKSGLFDFFYLFFGIIGIGVLAWLFTVLGAEIAP